MTAWIENILNFHSPTTLNPGSKTRKIPYPTKNPFTWIFLLVSCPNYTYEVTGLMTWVANSILSTVVKNQF